MPGRKSMYSVKTELIKQSREAALSAIQNYNNPLITFKSQTYIVLMIIAWTYLLHAYFWQEKVEYRYWEPKRDKSGKALKQRILKRIGGEPKTWELSTCLKYPGLPLDRETIANLELLIGIRNRIEHRMVPELDLVMASRYQACALNYAQALVSLFGEKRRIDHLLAYSLQFSQLTEDQIIGKQPEIKLPEGSQSFIDEYESNLPDEVFNDYRYAVNVKLVRYAVNTRNKAHVQLEFEDVYEDLERAYNEHERRKKGEPAPMILKERKVEVEVLVEIPVPFEPKKYRPSTVRKMMQAGGYPLFKQNHHTELFKAMDAKDESKGYGTEQEGTFYWYDKWVDEVRKHCKEHRSRYVPPATT